MPPTDSISIDLGQAVATMFELMEAVKDAATRLKRHYSHNSVSLSAGCDVFYQFISSLRDFGQAGQSNPSVH